jgi:hypothetical protein
MDSSSPTAAEMTPSFISAPSNVRD